MRGKRQRASRMTGIGWVAYVGFGTWRANVRCVRLFVHQLLLERRGIKGRGREGVFTSQEGIIFEDRFDADQYSIMELPQPMKNKRNQSAFQPISAERKKEQGRRE